MRITRRDFTALALTAAAMTSARPGFADEGVVRSHGASLTDELKYPPDFPHFDYVNPNAPKGGVARLGTQGSFDSFNPFIVKGDTPTGIGVIFDTLMGRSLDQGSTEYGLLAEWIEYPEDYSWASFRLREGAAWHDGTPITVEDVKWSTETLKEFSPQYAQYFKNVKEVRIDNEREVTFIFDQKNNRELPLIMGDLPVLPKHWWEATNDKGEKRDFNKALRDPSLAASPNADA